MAKKKINKSSSKKAVKVEEVEVLETKKGKKKKKHHVGRWILISCLTLFVVAPVSFVFGAFFDSSTRQIDDTVEKFDTKLASTLSNSVNKIGEGQTKFEMTLGKDFTSSLLANVNSKIQENANISKFIKKLYCDIKGNTWTFYVEAQASFFKTKLTLVTELGSEERNGELTYVFKIKNLILGRLPLINLAKSILPKFISEDQLTSILNSSALSGAKFNYNNMEITFPQSAMKTAIGKVLSGSQIRTDNQFANIVLSLYDKLTPVADFKDGLSLTIDLSSLLDLPEGFTARGSIYREDDYKTKQYAEFVEQQFNAGTVAEENLSKLFNCILTGYNSSEHAEMFNNTTLKDNFEKKYGTLSHYQGIDAIKKNRVTDSTKIATITNDIKDSTKIAALINEGTLNFCTIEETALTNYVRGTSLIGSPTITTYSDSNGTKHITYTTIDDFVFNISTSDGVQIYTVLNINGLKIPMTINGDLGAIPNNEEKIDRSFIIDPKTVYVGLNELTDQSLIFDFFDKSFSGSDLFKVIKKTEGEQTKYYFAISTSNIKIPDITEVTEFPNITTMINDILSGNNTVKNPAGTGDDLNGKDFTLSFSADTKDSKNLLSLSVQYTKSAT